MQDSTSHGGYMLEMSKWTTMQGLWHNVVKLLPLDEESKAIAPRIPDRFYTR